ncbi:MAG: hypothetical protein JW915_01125 [Chitinispirillaceae bacterium]|nr:hypothetical protein [Chitinispirillaceae bacterium]
MSQRALICVVILFCLNLTSVNAQLPNLDPAQTVNPATGEMGFSLPLGAVAGRNGTSFPISIGYKAGIQASQEASPVGLGFGYGAGSITRKVIHVPDDNDGGDQSYRRAMGAKPSCDEKWWRKFLAILSLVLGVVMIALSKGGATPVAKVFFVFSLASFTREFVSFVTFDPNSFVAGGSHSEPYDPEYAPGEPEHGRGFFKENGVNRDSPDMYFVSTPFISGELVWCGNYTQNKENLAKNGYFLFKETRGGSKKENRTIKVDYDVDAETFLITLPDGTRLFFEDAQYGGTSCSKIFWQASPEGGGIECYYEGETRQIQRVPEQWLLTKVLYPDYIDNGGDCDPGTDPELAKGAWITFHYKHTTPVNARPLPSGFQMGENVTMVTSPGSDPVDPAASVYEEVQLEWVKTPYQSAKYCYSESRLDNLWFKFDKMRWPAFTRSELDFAPAKCVKRISADEDPDDPSYVKGLRLDSILVFSANDDTLRRIRFKTDYTLKPGSLSSYLKKADGGFETNPQNPNAACLTLKSVEVTDSKCSKTYSVYFNYIESDVHVWDSMLTVTPEGPDPVPYYIERKDYWGYFYPNDKNRNDFNVEGSSLKTFATEYWSLKQVQLPSGMNISWDYEPHCYDAANNLPVECTTPVKRFKKVYGGGIRVKKMTIHDGLGKDLERSYFYTDVAGDFIENYDNSSGHATAEPFPYLQGEGNDPRKEQARGGYYTGAKICYEMVQVVDGYKKEAGTPGVAPVGFTVYEYITPKDNSEDNIFINEGPYGEIDNSWKRGALKTKSVYNGKKQLLSKEKYYYEFIEQNKRYEPAIFEIMDSAQYYHYEHRCGWVKPVKTETTVNGVTTTTYQKFASDLNTGSNPDKLHFFRNELQLKDIKNAGNMPESNTMYQSDRALSCRTKRLKGTAASDAYDYLVVRTEYNPDPVDKYITIAACANVNEDPVSGSWTRDYSLHNIRQTDVYLVGAALFKMNDSNQDDDLIVLARPVDCHPDYLLYVYIFHDIEINGENMVAWTGDPSFTIVTLDNSDLNYVKNSDTYKYNHPIGSSIGNFYDGASPTPPKPDFIIFTGVQGVSFGAATFPGDNVQDGTSINENFRNILAFTNFEEGSYPGAVKTMKLWRNGTDQLYSYYGDQGYLTDKDGSGVRNDLVIVGAGRKSAYVTNFDNAAVRHVAYQIYNNISWTGDPESANPCYLGFSSTACSNCNNAMDQILFNLRPNYANNWMSTRFSGFFDEGSDILKFVFFSEGSITPSRNPNYRHFYFLNYLPVYYDGDYDGAPNRTYTKSNDGSILLSATTPAFCKYPEMDYVSDNNQKHMLAPSCGAATMKFPTGTTDDVLCGELFTETHARKVLASSATTWAPLNGNTNAYLPVSSYGWEVPMNATGIPAADYTAFNYTAGTDNGENWKLGDSICKYTANSQAKETARPTGNDGRLHSTTVYGHKGILPVAAVTRASFEECGVFTCDYDNGESGYFDLDNVWEKGVGNDHSLPGATVELSLGGLFSEKCVHVINAWGPTRNIRLTEGQDYMMTAWVKVVSGKAWMAGDFRHKAKNVDTWPSLGLLYENLGWNHSETGPTSGKWVLLKMKIPAKTVLADKDWGANNWYARVFVGAVTGGEVYITDIRVAPVKAFITSTYYDTLFNLPVMTVDANNNPGNKAAYDELGRISEVYKIKKGDFEHPVLLQKKEYYLQGDFLAQNHICLLSPNGTERFTAGQRVSVAWEMLEKGNVTFSYKKEGDATYTDIITQPYAAGYRNFSWIIPGELSGDYKFKVTNTRNDLTSCSDESDMPFNIKALAIQSPVSTSEWAAGVRYQIKWVFAGPGTVDIFYDNGTTLDTIEVDVSNADGHGTYEWDVPLHYKTNPNSKIVIFNHVNNSQKIESQNFLLVENSRFIPKWLIGLFGKL